MSKMNFRLLGDKIYTLILPLMNKYTTLVLEKESFIKMIKSGVVQYENVNLRKENPINFLLHFDYVDISMKDFRLIVPDEKEHLFFEGNSLNIVIEVKSFDDTTVEKVIKNILKEMSDNFIKEAASSMDKSNKQTTLLDKISESFYKRIILNMRVKLNNVSIMLNHANNSFVLNIDEIDFSNQDGITQFQGMKLRSKRTIDKLYEFTILEKCSFNTKYTGENHMMKLQAELVKFHIDTTSLQAVIDIVQECLDNLNKMKCYKKKMIAQYPTTQWNKTDNYTHKWKYLMSILRKLKQYSIKGWYSVFDLDPSTYEQLAIEYYNTNKESNLLLIKKKLLLKYSKAKAEELILENKKKGNSIPLINLFFKKQDPDEQSKPVELTEDERNILEKVYSKDSILEFITGQWETQNFVEEKLNLFKSKLKFNISVTNFHLCIYNSTSNHKYPFSELTYEFTFNKQGNWFESYTLSIGNITNNSLIQEKTKDYLVQIQSLDKTIIDFGFKNIIIDKDKIDFFYSLWSSLRFHSWDNIFIKRSKKKTFELDQYTLESIPFICLSHKENNVMLIIYSLACPSPHSISIDFEMKETKRNYNIISRSTVLLSYEWYLNKYMLQLNNLVCLVSIPLVKLINEIPSMYHAQEPKQKNKEVFHMKPIANYEGSFCIKFNNTLSKQKFIFDTQLLKLQLGLIENQSSPIFMLSNIQLTIQKNEIFANIGNSYLLISKQITSIFSILYNQYSTNIPTTESNLTDKVDATYHAKIDKNIVEYQVENSLFQLITENINFKNETTSMSFSSKSSVLFFYSQEFEKSFELLKIENGLNVDYSTVKKVLTSQIPNPMITLNLPTIDLISNILSNTTINEGNTLSSSPTNEINSSAIAYEVNIIAPKITFYNFDFHLERLEISNTFNRSSHNVKCFNFVMSNNGMKLIKEPNLNIDIDLSIKYKCDFYVFFSNLQIHFLQQHITELVSCLNYKSSIQNYNKISQMIELKGEYNDQNRTTKMNLIVKIPKLDINFSIKARENLLSLSGDNIGFDFIQDNGLDIVFIMCSTVVNFWDFNNDKFVLISTNNAVPCQKEVKLIDYEDLTFQPKIIIKLKDNCLDISFTSIKIHFRMDAFYAIYSYFLNAIPIRDGFTSIQESNAELKITTSLANSSFELQTSFDNNEMLVIQIDKLYLFFKSTTKENKPNRDFDIIINSVRGEFVEVLKRRKLFNSKSSFLNLKVNIFKDALTMSMVFDTISVNLSYKDTISFLKAYHIGLFYFNKEKRIPPPVAVPEIKDTFNSMINYSYLIFEENFSSNVIDIKTKKIDITLIDKLQNSYYPFLNVLIDELSIKIKNQVWHMKAVPSVHTYNYISCNFEPCLEPVLIVLIYKNDQLNEAKNQTISCNIQEDILINLSDMNICLTSGAFNRWIELFLKEKKSYEESFSDRNLKNVGSKIYITDHMTEIYKISNNHIRNITGDAFKVLYQGSTLECVPGSTTDLEYIDDTESEGKIKEIMLIYSHYQFNFPIEKIGTRMHRLDNSSFFISEISLTKQLSVEVCVYSPVIFQNKSKHGITIIFRNQKDAYYMILPSKSKRGVPLNYLDSYFEIYFGNIPPKNNKTPQSINSISEILNLEVKTKYSKRFYIEYQCLLVTLVRNTPYVRKMVITPEYVIVNYLPCFLMVNCGEKHLILEKSSVLEIDFQSDLDIFFSIQIYNEIFCTKKEKYFQRKDKVFYLEFINKQMHSFNLTVMIYEKPFQMGLIIYSDYLIKNTTGVNLNMESENSNNNPLCFALTRDIFLISSGPDIDSSWISLYSGCFQSEKIHLKDLLSTSFDYSLKMMNQQENQFLNFTIQSTISYLPKTTITLTELLCTIIFTIHPMCRIHNLLNDIYLYISLANNKKKFQRISPLESISFNFFNLGKETRVCFSIGQSSVNCPNEWTDPFYINKFDLYTCCVSSYIFNVEIRQNTKDNINDVYIINSTEENTKTIINNQTFNKIAVYRKGNDSEIEIINPQTKKPFQICSIKSSILTFMIDNIVFEQNIAWIGEPKTTRLNDNTLVYMESNGLKSYFMFYGVNKYDATLPEDNIFNFDMNLSCICISLIGDNMHKERKFLNYKRNEIILLELKDISISVKNRSNSLLVNKITSQILSKVSSINIYNQISPYGKFAVVLSNKSNPTIDLSAVCAIYPMDKIWSFKELNFNINPLAIGIDPDFIKVMIHFAQNFLERMNIKNFNVDHIFINHNDISSSLIKKNKLIEEYQSGNILCHLKGFNVPPLSLKFELSQIGLSDLIKKYCGFSSYISSIVSNLAGKKHQFNLNGITSFHHLGTISNLISLILNHYMKQLFGQIKKIKYSEVLKQLFLSGFKKKETKSDNVILHRKRLPRPFYGRYKGIKSYDSIHADIYDIIVKIFGKFSEGYHFIDGIKTTEKIIIFTTMHMIIINHSPNIETIIDYFSIKFVAPIENTVLIAFNQQIDNAYKQTINFSNTDLAVKICEKLQKALGESGDEINLL